MQRAQLRDDKEQKEHAEPAGVQEVLSSLQVPYAAQGKQIVDSEKWTVKSEIRFLTFHFPLQSFPLRIRGMVSMVSMEVSKTLGPGSSPGTPAIYIYWTK